jgi:hypothetical protein
MHAVGLGCCLAALLDLAVLPREAIAQQPSPTSWQELALREQQNATLDKMIANGMIAALQAEVAELKAALAKHDPPAAPVPEAAK